MVSCCAGSWPMINTRAEPSNRPRWKMGPHSTRNWSNGYTSASGYSRTKVLKGSSKYPGSNRCCIVFAVLHYPITHCALALARAESLQLLVRVSSNFTTRKPAVCLGVRWGPRSGLADQKGSGAEQCRRRREAQFLQQIGGNACRKVEIKRRGIFSKTNFGGNIRTSTPSTTRPAQTSDHAAA